MAAETKTMTVQENLYFHLKRLEQVDAALAARWRTALFDTAHEGLADWDAAPNKGRSLDGQLLEAFWKAMHYDRRRKWVQKGLIILVSACCFTLMDVPIWQQNPIGAAKFLGVMTGILAFATLVIALGVAYYHHRYYDNQDGIRQDSITAAVSAAKHAENAEEEPALAQAQAARTDIAETIGSLPANSQIARQWNTFFCQNRNNNNLGTALNRSKAKVNALERKKSIAEGLKYVALGLLGSSLLPNPTSNFMADVALHWLIYAAILFVISIWSNKLKRETSALETPQKMCNSLSAPLL